MNRSAKRLFFITVSIIMLFGVLAINTAAEDKSVMSITLRIEGIDENIYYNTLDIPYTDNLTLQTALAYIDEQEDSFEITGVDTAYITDINDQSASRFGGWDGWMYKVNGLEPAVGIDGFNLKDGDRVLLYYGDPYGVGMQFPEADTSRIADGIIRFTSRDTTFNDDYSAIVSENPVANAEVHWGFGSEKAIYTTDDNGEIRISRDQLTPGVHKVQISKKSDKGLPLVLRFASDYTVVIDDKAISETNGSTDTPHTGDGGEITALLVLAAALMIIISAAFYKRNKSI
ncbi:MAG: DUF4430 domain-containing protein [Eubacteriales bacterium]|nr:DUF4430 domain-containing protein [Eubacteriales bacterium]